MAHDFIISQRVRNGKTAFYGKKVGTNENEFVVGFKTTYLGNAGIFNLSNLAQVYDPLDYENEHGFWAWFIQPTAQAESKGNFTCLNTYDRARFTFGFMQYASHVPNGDFVMFMRRLLALPEAQNYFPALALKNGRIHLNASNGQSIQLEDDLSTMGLMNFFNPTLTAIENDELDRAARMVHWASTSPAHRKLQVDVALDHFKSNMREYHQRFNLHGRHAKVCLLVCDIRHQGRGRNTQIAAALNTGSDHEKAFSNLCAIGADRYGPRITTVRTTIRKLENQGLFNKKYDSSVNDFVSI